MVSSLTMDIKLNIDNSYTFVTDRYLPTTHVPKPLCGLVNYCAALNLKASDRYIVQFDSFPDIFSYDNIPRTSYLDQKLRLTNESARRNRRCSSTSENR